MTNQYDLCLKAARCSTPRGETTYIYSIVEEDGLSYFGFTRYPEQVGWDNVIGTVDGEMDSLADVPSSHNNHSTYNEDHDYERKHDK